MRIYFFKSYYLFKILTENITITNIKYILFLIIIFVLI